MERAPKIGDRVRYRSSIFPERETIGIVTRIYVRHDDIFDDDGEFVQRGPVCPEHEWKATVKPDWRPDWWPYPNNDCFCPDVAELEAIR